MKKPSLNSVRLKRVEGDVVTISLALRLDMKSIPAVQMRKFWKSLATAMVCTMTQREQNKFQRELDAEMRKFRKQGSAAISKGAR